MNEIVRGLVGAGLLARQAHPEHGRVIQLYLTPAGQAALGEAHDRVNGVEAHMLDGLKPAEAETLAGWLRQCADSLDALEP